MCWNFSGMDEAADVDLVTEPTAAKSISWGQKAQWEPWPLTPSSAELSGSDSESVTAPRVARVAPCQRCPAIIKRLEYFRAKEPRTFQLTAEPSPWVPVFFFCYFYIFTLKEKRPIQWAGLVSDCHCGHLQTDRGQGDLSAATRVNVNA